MPPRNVFGITGNAYRPPHHTHQPEKKQPSLKKCTPTHLSRPQSSSSSSTNNTRTHSHTHTCTRGQSQQIAPPHLTQPAYLAFKRQRISNRSGRMCRCHSTPLGPVGAKHITSHRVARIARALLLSPNVLTQPSVAHSVPEPPPPSRVDSTRY